MFIRPRLRVRKKAQNAERSKTSRSDFINAPRILKFTTSSTRLPALWESIPQSGIVPDVFWFALHELRDQIRISVVPNLTCAYGFLGVVVNPSQISCPALESSWVSVLTPTSTTIGVSGIVAVVVMPISPFVFTDAPLARGKRLS